MRGDSPKMGAHSLDVLEVVDLVISHFLSSTNTRSKFANSEKIILVKIKLTRKNKHENYTDVKESDKKI